MLSAPLFVMFCWTKTFVECKNSSSWCIILIR
jgi:hypothetical protein